MIPDPAVQNSVLMDVIYTERIPEGYRAHVVGDPEKYADGASVVEAVGHLVFRHGPGIFDAAARENDYLAFCSKMPLRPKDVLEARFCLRRYFEGLTVSFAPWVKNARWADLKEYAPLPRVTDRWVFDVEGKPYTVYADNGSVREGEFSVFAKTE